MSATTWTPITNGPNGSGSGSGAEISCGSSGHERPASVERSHTMAWRPMLVRS